MVSRFAQELRILNPFFNRIIIFDPSSIFSNFYAGLKGVAPPPQNRMGQPPCFFSC